MEINFVPFECDVGLVAQFKRMEYGRSDSVWLPSLDGQRHCDFLLVLSWITQSGF